MRFPDGRHGHGRISAAREHPFHSAAVPLAFNGNALRSSSILTSCCVGILSSMRTALVIRERLRLPASSGSRITLPSLGTASIPVLSEFGVFVFVATGLVPPRFGDEIKVSRKTPPPMTAAAANGICQTLRAWRCDLSSSIFPWRAATFDALRMFSRCFGRRWSPSSLSSNAFRSVHIRLVPPRTARKASSVAVALSTASASFGESSPSKYAVSLGSS